MAENIEGLVGKLMRQFEAKEEDITPNAQSLWDRLKKLARVPIKNWKSLDYLLVIFTDATVGVLYHTKNAAKQLEYSESKKEAVNSIIKGKILPIFEFFAEHAKRGYHGENNSNSLIDELGTLRAMLEGIKGEVERQCDDFLDQTILCADNRENARFARGISGCVGLLSSVAVLSPWTPALKIPPLSQGCIFGSLGIAMLCTFVFVYYTWAIHNYKKAITNSKDARHILVEAKIAVDRFITNVDKLDTFRRMFTEDEMIDILRGQATKLRNLNSDS